jgi:hypothetical protein
MPDSERIPGSCHVRLVAHQPFPDLHRVILQNELRLFDQLGENPFTDLSDHFCGLFQE